MSKKIAKKPGEVEMVTIHVEVPKNMYQDYLDFLRNYRIKPEEHLLDFVFDACIGSFEEEYMMATLAAIVDRSGTGYAECYQEYLTGGRSY